MFNVTDYLLSVLCFVSQKSYVCCPKQLHLMNCRRTLVTSVMSSSLSQISACKKPLRPIWLRFMRPANMTAGRRHRKLKEAAATLLRHGRRSYLWNSYRTMPKTTPARRSKVNRKSYSTIVITTKSIRPLLSPRMGSISALCKRHSHCSTRGRLCQTAVNMQQ